MIVLTYLSYLQYGKGVLFFIKINLLNSVETVLRKLFSEIGRSFLEKILATFVSASKH